MPSSRLHVVSHIHWENLAWNFNKISLVTGVIFLLIKGEPFIDMRGEPTSWTKTIRIRKRKTVSGQLNSLQKRKGIFKCEYIQNSLCFCVVPLKWKWQKWEELFRFRMMVANLNFKHRGWKMWVLGNREKWREERRKGAKKRRKRTGGERRKHWDLQNAWKIYVRGLMFTQQQTYI